MSDDEGIESEASLRVLSKLGANMCPRQVEAYLVCKESSETYTRGGPADCLEQAQEVQGCLKKVKKSIITKCPAQHKRYVGCLDFKHRLDSCRLEEEEWNDCVFAEFGFDPQKEWQTRYFRQTDVNADWKLYDHRKSEMKL